MKQGNSMLMAQNEQASLLLVDEDHFLLSEPRWQARLLVT
jgi:hypothetical protein